MKKIDVVRWGVEDFGPYVGKHEVPTAPTGLHLVTGEVQETGDGSGAGKSHLLWALPFILGKCPYPATALQSWYTENPPSAWAEFQTPEGYYAVRRSDGLQIVRREDGQKWRGRAAEAELDRVFGMDADLRTLVTYRGQKEPGAFLGLTSPRKVEVLVKLLPRLERFEAVAKDAQKAATAKREAWLKLQGARDAARTRWESEKVPKCFGVTEGPVDADLLAAEHGGVLQAEARLQAARVALEAGRQEVQNRSFALLESIAQRRREVLNQPEPDEVVVARAEIVKSRERLARGRKLDEDRRAKLELDRENARASLVEATTARDGANVLRKEITRIVDELATMRGARCPRCAQPWTAPDCATDARRLQGSLLAMEERIQALDTTASEIGPRRAALEALGAFQTHPLIAQLEISVRDLEGRITEDVQKWTWAKQDAIGALDKESRQVLQAVKDEVDVAGLENRVVGLEIECRTIQNSWKQLEEAYRRWTRREEAIEAQAQVVAQAHQAYVQAEADVQKAEADYHFELDVAALAGREGFLGVIFDELLADVAAHANDLLGQVANVRHITLQFELEAETAEGQAGRKRIVPVVHLRGQRAAWNSPALSGGMREVVFLAVDLAFGEVVGKRRGIYPGWLFLDEALDGLGPRAKESCLEMLQMYAQDRLVVVVDHSVDTKAFRDREIHVVQVDGRSEIR